MSKTITIKEILKNPEKYRIVWAEPWAAIDETGKEVTAVVGHSISIKDCINVSRYACSKLNEKRKNKVILDEQGLLEEFMVIHWASIEGYQLK